VEDELGTSLGDGQWFPNAWVPTKDSCTCLRQDKRHVYNPNIPMDKKVKIFVLNYSSKIYIYISK